MGTAQARGSRGGPGVLLLLRVSPQHPTPLARLLPLPWMDWVILGACRARREGGPQEQETAMLWGGRVPTAMPGGGFGEGLVLA